MTTKWRHGRKKSVNGATRALSRVVNVRRWVVLLRGVNVGGHRKISMPRLVEALTSAGFEAVQTYIQSGNVILDSTDDHNAVRDRCAAVIEAEFCGDVAVVVRSVDELAELVHSHPGDGGGIDPKLLHVVFLNEPPTPGGRAKLDAKADQHAPDSWSYSPSGRELFVAYPNGSGRSRLNLDVIERHLNVTGTARNLNTVRQLVAMATSETAN